VVAPPAGGVAALVDDVGDSAVASLVSENAAPASGMLGTLAMAVSALPRDSQRQASIQVWSSTLASSQGHLRVFADEGAPMRALLGRLVTAQRAEQAQAGRVPPDYLGRLLRACDAGHAPPAAGTAPGLVEPLTARELEVLGLLAAGRSNQGIAEELVVSLDTVKKHASRALDKLGAANRTEVVARARLLDLLP
jgi:LuxR family transcriptional regulator, maltose regulon positive regulatory protein